MGTFEASVTLPRSRTDVFNFFRRPQNLLKLFPDGSTNGLTLKFPEIMDEGGQLEFQIRSLAGHFHFIHRIAEVRSFERLVLTQIQGPFKSWIQEQHFTDIAEGNTLLKTVIRFEPPGGMLGFMVTRKTVHSYLEKWIPYGHEIVRAELSSPIERI